MRCARVFSASLKTVRQQDRARKRFSRTVSTECRFSLNGSFCLTAFDLKKLVHEIFRKSQSRGISGTTRWADKWSFCNFANAISARHLATIKSPAYLREAGATNLWHRSIAFRSCFLLLRSAVRALQVHFGSAAVARSIHHLPSVIVRDDDPLQRLIGRKNPWLRNQRLRLRRHVLGQLV